MRIRRLALASALIVAVSACGGAGAAAPPPPYTSAFSAPTTVTYCTDGGVALTLDLFEPASPAPLHPLLIVVHGGSWAFGSSAMAGQGLITRISATQLLSRGFALASINYRLAPRNPWPAQIIDTRCAVRYLRETAPRWHLDPQRFTMLGNSAGGQLVSLLALSDGQVPQWDNGQHPGQSTAVRAVIDLWGPEDLVAGGWSADAIDIGRLVFQTTWGSQSAELLAASPVAYVHPGAPPFLIVQGTADQLVPPAQSTELRDRLIAAGDPVTLLPVAHAGHELRPSGGAAIAPTLDEVASRVVAFAAAAG